MMSIIVWYKRFAIKVMSTSTDSIERLMARKRGVLIALTDKYLSPEKRRELEDERDLIQEQIEDLNSPEISDSNMPDLRAQGFVL